MRQSIGSVGGEIGLPFSLRIGLWVGTWHRQIGNLTSSDHERAFSDPIAGNLVRVLVTLPLQFRWFWVAVALDIF